MNKTAKVILIILGILLLFFVFKGCSSYNTMVVLDEEVKRQWANVENVYQRRADLIPTLVGTIKGSSDFEQGTLTGVIEARAKATSVNIDASNLNEENMAQFQAAQSEFSTAISRLLVTIERYPDLKTTEQFRDMLAELSGTENRIANERMKFNTAAQAYNKYIRRFPQIIFARLLGFDAKAYFKSDTGSAKRVEVDFSEAEGGE